MIVSKVAILWMAIGLSDTVLGTYVHLNEKCFLKASHRYCQQHYPGHLRGCQARLDRRNLVMKAEESQICYIGGSNGKCISYDVCIVPEILVPPTAVRSTTTPSSRRTTTGTRSTTTTATTTTTLAPERVAPDGSIYAGTLMDNANLADDKFLGDWPSHGQPTLEWADEPSNNHVLNAFSVLGLTTSMEVVLFCTLIALSAMLLLHLTLLGCQLCFVWSQKRTNRSLDQVLTKALKTWKDLELDQERGLAVQARSDGPAVIGVLEERNSFRPDGTSGFHRSTGAIPKTQVKSARGTGGNVKTGGLFGSLTRAKPPQAPPMPPRRSLRGASSGQARTLNSLPALNQFDSIELDNLDESHV